MYFRYRLNSTCTYIRSLINQVSDYMFNTYGKHTTISATDLHWRKEQAG